MSSSPWSTSSAPGSATASATDLATGAAVAAAQAAADAAALIIANASNDSIITNLERPALRNLRASLAASVASSQAQANAMVPAVTHAALDSAWATFTANVDPILAATADSAITKATFDGWWSAVYSAITDLAGVMSRQAQDTGNTALSNAAAAQTAANNAQTAANNAQASANTANTALANIASDSILSPGEKPAVVLDYTNITNEQAGIDAQADAYGVSRTAYDAAVSALTSYLGTLTGWNVIPGSDVAIVGTTFRQKFADVYSTRQSLLNAIYAQAKALADAAQSTGNTAITNAAAAQTAANNAQTAANNAQAAANTANAALANIASDSILSPGEKPAVVLDYTNITNEQAGIDAQADAYGVSRTSYDAAVSALTSYLGTLTGWNVIPGSDVAIVGTTFRQKFSDVYSNRQALLNAIYAKAKALADAAQATGNTAQTGVNTINDPDTLTTGEKPQIILDYNAITGENADLVAKANAYGVSHSTYDTAYSALLSYLSTLTSPTAWNSLSGTTALGTGNRVALWNPKWTAVKNAAADLRNAIAVGTAQSAISTAATDATNKANAAQLASQPHQVAWAYASKPALPSALYPAGYYAITTDARTVQVNATGTAWTDVLVAATGLFGQLFANQLVVTNFDNLMPNPTSEMDLTNAPAGSIEAVGVVSDSTNAFVGSRCRKMSATTAGTCLDLTGLIPCSPGDAFYLAAKVKGSAAGVQSYMALRFGDAAGNTTTINGNVVTGSTYADATVTAVAPAGTVSVQARWVNAAAVSGEYCYADNLYLRRMADASLLVDGTLQALVARVPLLYSLDLRSGSDASGYTPGTATTPPIGFRISATQFTTTYIGGTTDSDCHMELSGSENIGGYKAQTYADRVFQTFNRVGNGLLAYGMFPWGYSTDPPTYGYGRTAGLGSLEADGPVNEMGTYTCSVYQSISLPKLYPGQVVNLDLYTGFAASKLGTKSGYVKAYLLDSSGTEALINTWNYSTDSTQSMTWTQRITDISSNVSAGGDYVIRFEISATNLAGGASSVAICEIKIVA